MPMAAMTPNSRKARNSEMASERKVSAATSAEMSAAMPVWVKASRVAASELSPRSRRAS